MSIPRLRRGGNAGGGAAERGPWYTAGMDPEPFMARAKRAIASIPFGQVATYGQVAACAGNHRAARQVAWLLHSASDKEGLPWHRVIGGRGTISLPRGGGFEEQRARLEDEGVSVDEAGRIDLRRYLCTLHLDSPHLDAEP